jgi:hypothetical protein
VFSRKLGRIAVEYEVIAARDAADILREAIERRLPERTASEDEEDKQSDE